MNAPSTPQIPLLDLDLLRTLVAISETGNFSAAADVVHRTPSAISMQVKKMEDMLGRPIFLRDSRRVDLTEDGIYLLEHARRMLALNRDAIARFVTPELKGVVRLGAPDDIGAKYLPAMLCRFAETHPGVTVNVIVEGSFTMARMIKERSLDLAIVTCHGSILEEGVETLVQEQLVWAMRSGGVAVECDPIPMAVWNQECSWRQAAEAALRGIGREWRVAFQSAHITGQRAAIMADLAIAPLSESSLGGEIVEVPDSFGLPKLPTTSLGLLTQAEPDAHVDAAADHLRAAFSQVLRS